MKVVLRMLFLFFSNADIRFAELEKLTKRLYTTAKVLFTPSLIELIGKREFAKVTLYEDSKTFIVHISDLEATIIYLF